MFIYNESMRHLSIHDLRISRTHLDFLFAETGLFQSWWWTITFIESNFFSIISFTKGIWIQRKLHFSIFIDPKYWQRGTGNKVFVFCFDNKRPASPTPKQKETIKTADCLRWRKLPSNWWVLEQLGLQLQTIKTKFGTVISLLFQTSFT